MNAAAFGGGGSGGGAGGDQSVACFALQQNNECQIINVLECQMFETIYSP